MAFFYLKLEFVKMQIHYLLKFNLRFVKFLKLIAMLDCLENEFIRYYGENFQKLSGKTALCFVTYLMFAKSFQQAKLFSKINLGSLLKTKTKTEASRISCKKTVSLKLEFD